MTAKTRSRGRAYTCACREEKLRLTRKGVEARVDGWGYLFGKCGGGVKLRFEGIKVVEVRAVEFLEARRVRTAPVKSVDALEAMLGELDDKARARLDAIVVEIRENIQQGALRWMTVGRLLFDAKRLLKKGDFGLWVERNGLDRVHAHRFIAVYEMLRGAPAAFSQTSVKIGWEKTALLARLPEAKRLELVDRGVPINGKPTPLDQVTFRQLNAFVRSIVGKDPRGRKKKGDDGAKPTERMGLAIETFEAFQGVLKGLQLLRRRTKEGWSDRERPAAKKLWASVRHLFYDLDEDRGMGALVEADR